MTLALILVFLLLGVLLVVVALKARGERGFISGQTLSLDDLVLYSEQLKLTGRPDRLVRQGEFIIPEEWKPRAKRLYPSARLQLGVYLILVEERFGRRPPFGVVVIHNGERVEVENTEALRAEVLEVAQAIRHHRRQIETMIPVSPPAWKCRVCGQRSNCGQARA